jgi:hypothetical protein
VAEGLAAACKGDVIRSSSDPPKERRGRITEESVWTQREGGVLRQRNPGLASVGVYNFIHVFAFSLSLSLSLSVSAPPPPMVSLCS